MPPFNGSGSFSPYTPGNPAVTGTVISSTAYNATQQDIAAGLSNAVTRDGQSPLTANLPAAGRKITGLDAGVVAGDSLRFEQLFSQGAEQDIASAATVDIGSLNTTIARITGTTTITSFGTNYNGPRFVRFAGVLTLTHNATTLILPGGANITTAAGDRAILTPVGNPGSGWQVLAYEVAALTPGTASTVAGTVAIANGGTGQTTAAAAIAALFGTRADIASAATVDLSSAVSSINITGTTTITAFTVAVGRLIFVRFNAALTLTNNASIVTQTGANIVTTAGDTCVLRATAANVVEVLSYTPAVLNQQTTRSMVRVNTANGYGSTNTVIRRFSTVVTNQGADVTYADSATLGALFTINVSGVYGLSYVDNFVAAADLGISLNSTQLTTAIGSITAADRIAEASTSGTSTRSNCAVTIYLPAGSLIRPHTGGGTNSVAATTQFTITRVA